MKRILCAVCTCAISVCNIGCGPRTAERTESSVKPGINDPYRNVTDVDEWVKRFEGESREIYRERTAIVDAIGLRPGMRVADIGAGTGLFTHHFARRVGEDGRVYAVDIVPAFLDLIRDRAAERNLPQVETVLCRDDSVELRKASVDLVFVCDTYHHFEFPRSTLASIHSALRPGGTLIIIDFIRIPGQSRDWILEHVRCGRETVIEEVTAAGFEWTDDAPTLAGLEENYILRFRRR